MTITISNAKRTPKWETLQSVIRECTGDEYGRIVRITRPDGNCDYRGIGEYIVEFRTDCSDILTINLKVTK